MHYQSEAELEKHLLEKLQEIDYEYVNLKDYNELVANFRKQLNIVNKEVLNGEDLTDTEFNRIMIKLNNNTVFNAAKIVRDKLLLERESGEKIHLTLLDKYPENNIWQVSNQIRNEEFNVKNRYDVTILINGLPLVQIELKRSGVEINEAINQIDRYRLESFKGLFKFISVFVVSNGNETRYYANTDSKNIIKSLTFYWTDISNNRINNLDDFCFDFFKRTRLNKLLYTYTVLSESNKSIMVMRPYQIYAVELFVDRAKNTDKNAYVSHCTGSGKTLTSFKLSQTMINEPSIKKVIFLIDRRDLDYKTIDDFNSYEKGSVDMTNNTSKLVKDIQNKHKKLIVTTIQKMANAINKPSYRKVIEAYQDDKCILIIDECHRSQFGKMHADIKRFFINSQYFGFTGTPRYSLNCAEGERTTSDIFDKCLHQYMMINAIHDHNVLGFNIEYMQTYKGQYTENDPVAKDKNMLKDIYESDERVTLVANHIYNHHKQKTVNGKYTAIFATSSIDMLSKYYYAFKKINKDNRLKIGAVFSFGQNEDCEGKDSRHKDVLIDIIKDYNEITETDFSLETYDLYNRDISKRLQKNSSQPFLDILIVVDQYLTGFDSKPTNTLYVDKNLKYHNLVQAFSRTNRVYEKSKKFGNIVCFRDLKKETDEALKLFNGGQNTEDIFTKKYEDYVEVFTGNVDALKGLCPTVNDIDSLIAEPDKKKFIYAFRDLVNTISTLETFVDFTWDKEEITSKITRQEYEDFKGRYRQMYEDIMSGEGVKENGEPSDLSDIDFEIELIQNDKINAFYIMNLIRNINYEDEKQKEKDIQFILEELKRADNVHLKNKEGLLRKFIEEIVINLTSSENIDELYLDFETKERQKEIDSFAKENTLDSTFVKKILAEFDFSHYLDSNTIRDKFINKGMDFFEVEDKLEIIEKFINENSSKYRS